MGVERFNEGLLIGLSVSKGLTHIKKVYEANHNFIERFNDGLKINKVISLEGTYILNTAVWCDVVKPPEPPIGDLKLSIINRFNLNSKAIVEAYRGLYVDIVSDGLRLKSILEVLKNNGVLEGVLKSNKYDLKTTLNIELKRYKELYIESKYLLKSGVSVELSSVDKGYIELTSKYLLDTILKIEGIIEDIESSISNKYGLSTGVGIKKTSKQSRLISNKYVLNSKVSIEKTSVDTDNGLTDRLNFVDNLKVTLKEKELIVIKDDFIDIKDKVTYVVGGTYKGGLTDDLIGVLDTVDVQIKQKELIVIEDKLIGIKESIKGVE